MSALLNDALGCQVTTPDFRFDMKSKPTARPDERIVWGSYSRIKP